MILGRPPQRVRAFVVGLVRWQRPADYAPFPADKRRDVRLAAHLLATGVPDDQLVYLADDAATTATIRASFDALLAASRPDELLLCYFAGHGTRSDGGATHFASYDAGAPRNPGWGVEEIPRSIERGFRGSHALLLADCCHSGALADAVDDHGDRVAYATLASSLSSELSTGNWTFTEGVHAALAGHALADSDGSRTITLREMAEQVRANLAFAEEQLATFRIRGAFDPGVVVAAARPRSSADVGRRVEVEDGGDWYPAQIVDAAGGAYQVHFFGYDDDDDAWVPPERIREAVRPRYPVGARVEVRWDGDWYPATVRAVELGVHKIHYEGYDDSDDEWVATGRMRRRG